ncbi:serine hydrolase, partial [Actinomycetaceae bacterium WB03_NA08]
VLSAVAGRDVLPQSVFQIGSITKVWTATLAMMLVDEGLLTLESRVIDIVPDFQVTDDRASRRITVKDLLTHANGLHGDIFTDRGRGNDALKLYVTSQDLRLAQPYAKQSAVLAGFCPGMPP